MSSMKFDAFVRPYRGSADDFDLFWRKFMVAANLQKWDTDEKRLANLPLFLEGDAFLVWDELSDDDKKSAAVVKQTLQDAFTLSPGQAYREFVSRTLGATESVDAYAADLRRLLAAAGQTADGKSPVLIEQFLRGLPTDYARQLRTNGDTSQISTCVQYVRGLRSVDTQVPQNVSAAVPGGSGSSKSKRSSVMCFKCHGLGHIARHCKASSTDAKPKSDVKKVVKCHFCDELGHKKDECPEWRDWKQYRQRKADDSRSDHGAAAVGGQDKKDQCAATPSRSCGLPRIYVDIARPQCAEPVRVRAVVDTASTKNLIAADVVELLSLPIVPTVANISAIDGNLLQVRGEVTLTLSRLGQSAIHLPSTETQLVVVDNLASLRADIVLGLQLISATGGVDVRYDDGQLKSVVFGEGDSSCASPSAPDRHPYKDVSVVEDAAGNVTLSTSDGSVRWNVEGKYWELTWLWANGEPQNPIGHGVGEYPRDRLSAKEEELFGMEVEGWITKGWLKPVESDQAELMCVLPLIAQVQEHKPSTPVRPCLDYRLLNEQIVSHPGSEAPACNEKLRKWRQSGPADEYELPASTYGKRICKSVYRQSCRNTKL